MVRGMMDEQWQSRYGAHRYTVSNVTRTYMNEHDQMSDVSYTNIALGRIGLGQLTVNVAYQSSVSNSNSRAVITRDSYSVHSLMTTSSHVVYLVYSHDSIRVTYRITSLQCPHLSLTS